MDKIISSTKASTLVETLVSLIIISITLSSIIYLFSFLSTRSIQTDHLYFEHTTDSLYQQVIAQKKVQNQSFLDPPYEIDIEVEQNTLNTYFKDVTITIYDNDEKKFTKDYVFESK